MSKILLVYDDFAELTAIDYSLKKVGFDVIALTNEFTIKDQIVAFNPDILICSGNSNRVSTLSVGKKIKEMGRWTGKSVLIFPASYEIPADDLLKIRMDMMLESPVPLTRLIQIIAKLTGQDDQTVIDKLVKSFANDKTDQQGFLNQDENVRNAIQHIQGQIAKMAEGKAEPEVGGKEKKPDFTLEAPKSIGDKKNTENTFSLAKEEKEKEDQEVSLVLDENKVDSKFSLENEGAKGSTSAKVEGEKSAKASSSAVTVKEGVNKKLPPDPFQALMQELSGESEDSEEADLEKSTTEGSVTEALVPEELSEEAKAELRIQLEQHQAKMSEKIKKYSEMTQNTSLYPESMLKKVKVRKQFNLLKKDWDKEDLSDLDDLRKEFVKALFKK